MRSIDGMFPSRWLTAADLGGADRVVTITELDDPIDVGGDGKEDDFRPVLQINEHKKGIVLNRTNADTIKAMYGEDVDTWPGRKITIYPTTTEYKGKTVACIRVKQGVPLTTEQPAQEPEQPAPSPEPQGWQ